MSIEIPKGEKEVEVRAGRRTVRLTNLGKVFWPELGITKRDLLQYYSDVSEVLVPHLRSRAMVMKRYPNGAAGDFFFMKRAPEPRPEWIRTCGIPHAKGNLIEFPMVDDLASLLWMVNLGCIDLNQWYATCEDVNRPDYVHFDLDPVPDATFDQVREVALIVRDTLQSYRMPCFAKTTGSRGIHIYVPIKKAPLQKQVWIFASSLARDLARRHPKLITAAYRISQRPAGRVLVDYNQNAWGRTLASVYSVRPKPGATVSSPVTWEEIEQGVHTDDYRLDNMPERIRKVGDLFAPLLVKRGRIDLERFL